MIKLKFSLKMIKNNACDVPKIKEKMHDLVTSPMLKLAKWREKVYVKVLLSKICIEMVLCDLILGP